MRDVLESALSVPQQPWFKLRFRLRLIFHFGLTFRILSPSECKCKWIRTWINSNANELERASIRIKVASNWSTFASKLLRIRWQSNPSDIEYPREVESDSIRIHMISNPSEIETRRIESKWLRIQVHSNANYFESNWNRIQAISSPSGFESKWIRI